MFERFTDRARRVVVLAQEEARLLNHNYIGTEHILLGVIAESESVGAQALESMGVSLEAVRARVVEIIGHGGPHAPTGAIPFTPRAKKVLELSLREALLLGHNHIGTEHILLGLIREGEGVGAQVLTRRGADLETVRQRVIELAAQRPESMDAGALPTWRMTQTSEPIGPFGGFRGSFAAGPTCSFCGRDLWDLGYRVASGGAVICEECVGEAGEAVRRARAEDRPVGTSLDLPPRTSGETPDADAVDEIRRVLEEVFGTPSRSPDLADVLEDGARLGSTWSDVRERVPQAARAHVRVARIRFDTSDRARVRFEIAPEGMAAVFPFEGDLVRADGRWRVSRETFCQLVARVGVQCPPVAD